MRSVILESAIARTSHGTSIYSSIPSNLSRRALNCRRRSEDGLGCHSRLLISRLSGPTLYRCRLIDVAMQAPCRNHHLEDRYIFYVKPSNRSSSFKCAAPEEMYMCCPKYLLLPIARTLPLPGPPLSIQVDMMQEEEGICDCLSGKFADEKKSINTLSYISTLTVGRRHGFEVAVDRVFWEPCLSRNVT